MQDALYEVMTLMVMKGPLSGMGSGKKETIEL
jgi:agmatinase